MNSNSERVALRTCNNSELALGNRIEDSLVKTWVNCIYQTLLTQSAMHTWDAYMC